jgi:hypothetical protein
MEYGIYTSYWWSSELSSAWSSFKNNSKGSIIKREDNLKEFVLIVEKKIFMSQNIDITHLITWIINSVID